MTTDTRPIHQANGVVWEATTDVMPYLGAIPDFLNVHDPRDARKQFQSKYIFGGWRPTAAKFAMDPTTHAISYPGDPTLYPLARATLRGEMIFYYRFSWVAVVQPDGSFEIARLD